MSERSLELPFEILTLARWIAQDPAERIAELERAIASCKPAEESALLEGAGTALRWAWDEQPKRLFSLLKPWFKSEDPRLRRLALGALPLSRPAFLTKALPFLKRAAQDPDAAVRTLAIDLLSDDASLPLDTLQRWADDPEPSVREAIARNLQHLSPERIKPALTLLEQLALDLDPRVHWAVSTTLLSLHQHEPRSILEVVHAMACAEDAGVRLAAATGFLEHRLADRFDATLPTLRSWLRTPQPLLRWTLVRSLSFIPLTPPSVHLLRALYGDADPEIRLWVVETLLGIFEQSLSPDAYKLVSELLERMSQDPDSKIRARLAVLLERCKDLIPA